MSARIVVVGIGADGMAGLSPASTAELRSATVVYGSVRQLDMLDSSIGAQRRQWPSPLLDALPTMFDGPGTVHVIASGDPMLHGIGATLIRVFGTDAVRVLPHVSSVTLACARLGWPVHETEVISLVTADPVTAVRRGGQAVVLSRDAGTPATLARLLTESGRGDSEFTVLENLGGADERITRSTAGTFCARVGDLNVIAVRYLPDVRRAHALPDESFAHDGQITKQSIRAVTLATLGPRPGELLWDVGSGSGSVAVEWCRSAPGCRAVSFERDADRRNRIAMNAGAFGVRIDVRSAAPEPFGDVAPPAAVFVGGGVTQPGLIEACVDRLPRQGRLVVNAVTVESEAALAQWYAQKGGELRRFQHYQGGPVGGFTAWRPVLPVTQWAWVKP